MTGTSPGTVRLGLVGGGSWTVYAHLPAIAAMTDAAAVALCEPNEQKLARVADEFGVPRRYTDLRDMIADGELDAVVVASPHVYHAQQARDALAHGLHVLVEKPMALRASDARQLVRQADETDRLLLVDYPWNYAEHSRWARAHVLDGAIGRVRCVASHFSSSAAALMRSAPLSAAERQTHGSLAFPPERSTYADPRLAGGGQGQTQTTHAAGLLLWLADLEVDQVSAFMASDTYPMDVVNTVSFVGSDGVLGSLTSLGTVPSGYPLRHDAWVYGDGGYIHLDAQRGSATLVRSATEERFGPLSAEQSYPTGAAVRNLVAAIRGVAPAESPGDVGRRSVELVAAAYASAAQGGRPVSVAELA